MGRTITATISLRLSTSTVAPGGTVGLFALLTNSSSSKGRFTVTFRSSNDCNDPDAVLGYTTVALAAGGSIQVTVSYPLAGDACTGTYTIEVTVEAGNKQVASDTDTLTVT